MPYTRQRWRTRQAGYRRAEDRLEIVKGGLPSTPAAAGVSDRLNRYDRFLLGVDDREWKFPKQKAACVVLANRPALRCLLDCKSSSLQLVDEVQGCLWTVLPIPSDSALNV